MTEEIALGILVVLWLDLRAAIGRVGRRVKRHGERLDKLDGGDPQDKGHDSGGHAITSLVALVAFGFLVLSGCSSTRTSSASVERTTGRQGDQVVDLTTVRREQAEAQTAVELGPVVQAAVAAATGDLRGAVRELAARPPAPSTAELEQLLAGNGDGVDGTAWGLAGGAGGLALLALREWMAHRRTRQSEDEAWEEIKRRAAAAPQPEKG